MATRTVPLLPLADLVAGQEADLFALLTSKEELKTRDGKPYFRVGFRDDRREVMVPIWSDSPFATPCRQEWTPGAFYKLRAVYRETSYGPQLDIIKIRETCERDAADGFDPTMFLPRSRFEPRAMYDELLAIAREKILDRELSALVVSLYETHRDVLLRLPAATHNHHAFVGGYLEHVLSVTRTCVYLADKYAAYYPNLAPPLNKDLVIAGALLHDIGKVRELDERPEGAAYSAAGGLIGHILQGRDMLREASAAHRLDPEVLLRLEHVIISHQRLPEWGSPKPPMTLEALLVHFADDIDAKFHMMYAILRDDTTAGPLTSKKNVLMQKVYRGPATTK